MFYVSSGILVFNVAGMLYIWCKNKFDKYEFWGIYILNLIWSLILIQLTIVSSFLRTAREYWRGRTRRVEIELDLEGSQNRTILGLPGLIITLYSSAVAVGISLLKLVHRSLTL